jgi:hypothetical protein
MRWPHVLSTNVPFSWPSRPATRPRIHLRPAAPSRSGGGGGGWSCRPAILASRRPPVDTPPCALRALPRPPPAAAVCAAIVALRHHPLLSVRGWSTTVRRRRSTSSTRKASSSATRNPSPACAITIARQRAGIASASTCACATVNGTIRCRSDRGDSPWRPGSRPPVGRGRRRCRPSAARPRAAAVSPGESTWARSDIHACTSGWAHGGEPERSGRCRRCASRSAR